MPRMKGRGLSDNLEETDLSEQDRLGITEAQGRVLAQLQELQYGYAGTYDLVSNTVKPLLNNYYEFVESSIIECLDKCRSYNQNTTDNDVQWILETIHKNKVHLQNVQPAYVRQDFKPGNMVVENIKNEWKITGIFDLMEGYIGFGESDLSRMFCCYIKHNRSDLAHSFIKSYIHHKGDIQIEDLAKRFPLFIILDRIIIWEWYQRNGRGDGTNFLEWVEPYLTLDLNKLL